MNFEDIQKTWQHQAAETKISINPDVLLKEVRRNQMQFRATIFWRDVREIGVAGLLTALFLYRGIHHHNWTLNLLALGCLFIGIFMVADRFLQRRRLPSANETLKSCVEVSLEQVSHQIWLLKNVVWWYLLPLAVPLGISVGRDMLRSPQSGLHFLVGYAVFCVLLFWGVYHLNQFAVRKNLEPRRQELKSLLAGLDQ